MTADFFTTLHYPLRGEWVRRSDVLDPELSATGARVVREVLHAARRHDVLVLNGSRHAEQVAAGLVALRHPSRRLVLADCTWQVSGSGLLDRAITRAGIRAIDRAEVTYCVLSTAELESFPRHWSVDRSRIQFTPWCHTLTDQELALPVTDGGYSFAGGDSMRDYGPLLEAAAGLAMPVRIAARGEIAPAGAVPANVTIDATTPERFTELMAGARVVVVPLAARDDRSAGQGTYLNAMALGKPVIVTDAIGVRDYVDADRTGLIVAPADAAAMRSALEWVDSERNRDAVRQLGSRARDTARHQFGPERYIESLLTAIDRGAAG